MKINRWRWLTTFCVAMCAGSALAQQSATQPAGSLPGMAYDLAFFPGAHYDATVPTPDEILGFPVGSKPATHAQIEAVIKAIAAKSPRTKLFEYAKTHEGRTLYCIAISSEANIRNLDQIKANAAKLADPREVSNGDADALTNSAPAIAWMAYTIHGDEMSGSDAALAVIHHLAASTDDDVKKLLDQLVILIDPIMNPDGRDRCLRMVAENRTVQPSVDDQSLIHSEVWPSGRMNHYLFDMNRDWIFGTQPETRGRIAAARDWHPQYFMESHEMGSQDTFLFMPAREPINPNLPENVRKWQEIFGKELGAAFDRMGWRYYTGEWNEDWYPGYSSSWGGLRGAVQNLYEQASIISDAVRRGEGTLQTYREAVHHQLVSTMANLHTLATNRKTVLQDYVANRRANVAADGRYAQRMFAIAPSPNSSRQRIFLDLMILQGFEVHRARKEFIVNARDRLGRDVSAHEFPAGTMLIANRQPEANLLGAMLEFDPRMTDGFLNDERRELLRFNRSKLYDITAWNITMLFDLDGYEIAMPLPADADKVAEPATPQAQAPAEQTAVGFVIDGADDQSVTLAGRLMEREVRVRVADKPFKFDNRDYPRGSVIVTRVDNRNFVGKVDDVVAQIAGELGVRAVPIQSGMGEGDLPDLGGEHFGLLEQPRIAVVGREGFGAYGFGEAWFIIDHQMGLRASYLDANSLSGTDLRRYNVIILPDGGGPRSVRDQIEPLKDWVQSGGTLIAIGSSAAALARAEGGIGSTRLLPDILGKLDEYRQQVVREWEGRNAVVDPASVWSNNPPAKLLYPWMIGQTDDKASPDDLKRQDAWRAIFMPQGAILAARVDDRSWLTFGCGEYLPVMCSGRTVLMSKDESQAPLRLGFFVPALSTATQPAQTAPASTTQPATQPQAESKPGWTLAPPGYELRMRMSGLLWPEAADRLAHSAYLTREQVGSGQVILFASSPTFRAASLGTTRVFTNAIVYGPGMGATPAIKP